MGGVYQSIHSMRPGIRKNEHWCCKMLMIAVGNLPKSTKDYHLAMHQLIVTSLLGSIYCYG